MRDRKQKLVNIGMKGIERRMRDINSFHGAHRLVRKSTPV